MYQIIYNLKREVRWKREKNIDKKIIFLSLERKREGGKEKNVAKYDPRTLWEEYWSVHCTTPSIFKQQQKSMREAVYQGHPGSYYHRALLTCSHLKH